jgi:hypothetical protein
LQLQPSKQLLSNAAKQSETDPPKAQAQQFSFQHLLVENVCPSTIPNGNVTETDRERDRERERERDK